MKTIPLLKESDIEVKVKKVTEKGAIALLYKTARTDMAMLDQLFGATGWTDDYKEIKGNLYCGIGTRQNEAQDFVWKWDCGIESREDEEGNQKKGEASDAFKRAGFKWGIGRELYTAPFIFINVDTKKNDKGKYVLANPFAKFVVKSISYDEERNIKGLTIADEKGNVVFSTGKKVDLKKDEPAFTQKEIEAVKPVLTLGELTLEEAKEFITTGGKKYGELTEAQLIYTIEHLKDSQKKQAARMVLDSKRDDSKLPWNEDGLVKGDSRK